MLNTKRI